MNAGQEGPKPGVQVRLPVQAPIEVGKLKFRWVCGDSVSLVIPELVLQ